MPPCPRFRKHRWTFGALNGHGYCQIQFGHKYILVHRLVCEAFHGASPAAKPLVDHIDRNRSNNVVSNLHWVSREENSTNSQRVDDSVARFGARCCKDPSAYSKAYRHSLEGRKSQSTSSRVYRKKHLEQCRARVREWHKARREVKSKTSSLTEQRVSAEGV